MTLQYANLTWVFVIILNPAQFLICSELSLLFPSFSGHWLKFVVNDPKKLGHWRI